MFEYLFASAAWSLAGLTMGYTIGKIERTVLFLGRQAERRDRNDA